MHPIVSALKHHKTTVALVVLEIALTCAIVTNALFVIGDRIAAMHLSTGVDDNALVWVRSSPHLDLGQGGKSTDDVPADLAALRGLPGVESVATSNALPLAGDYWSTSIFRRRGDSKTDLDNVVEYAGSPGLLKTLGIRLSQGRDFLPQEYTNYQLDDSGGDRGVPPTVVIITRALADALWPGQNPLGKTFWLDNAGKQAVQVVGVAAQLLNPSITPAQGTNRNFILPLSSVAYGIYVLRVRPDLRHAVAQAIPGLLRGIDPGRMIQVNVYADTVSSYYHNDRALVWLLLVVIGCLLALTALGVVGLSSFWVQQRTRQIGIRRAIGATRRDIVRYFQIENLLIVTLGIVFGTASAVLLNLWLMKHYELPHMALAWTGAGAALMWLLGQLAVLGPALRAANVPPVVATRSV